MSDQPTNITILQSVQLALDEYSALDAKISELSRKLEASIDALIPLEVKQAISENKKFYADLIDPLQEELDLLQQQIKASVILAGSTIQGTAHQCVYTKPSAKWNDERLQGYAITHPEILAMRDTSKPSASIRVMTKKDK